MPAFAKESKNCRMLNLNQLNEAQRRAVTHPKGPAMVLAGPGSGKTFLIVSRIQYLIEQGLAEPDHILVITFTKAAALSMESRFMISTKGEFPGVRFGTFHSFFYQILKEYDSYNYNSLFTIKEKKQYLKGIFARLKIPWDSASDYLSLLEKEDAVTLPDDITETQATQIRELFREEIQKDKKLDFDDMTGLVLKLLRKHPGILKILQEKYPYILVDEYQDTNGEQEEFLALLAGEKGQLMVVGDDDQSIYGFRGSKPEVMRQFKDRYPGAEIYYLEVNYRSTGRIVEAALKVISENKDRFAKNLRAHGERGETVRIVSFGERKEEFAYIAEQIRKRKGGETAAVIARTNRELEPLSLFLQKEGIRCYMREKGEGLAGHFLVKELLQCLEFAVGIRDRAPGIWNRIGGEEGKRRLLERQAPAAALHFLWKAMGYEKILRGLAAEEERRQGTLAELRMEQWQEIFTLLTKHAGKYSRIGDWLSDVGIYLENSWEGRGATLKQEHDRLAVQLLTMHGAKGLEFSYVCILNVNEENIPGKRSRKKEEIEEERRLLYVAMTRAKKVLDILYLTGREGHPRLPSRFLNCLLKGETYSSSTSSSNSTLSRNSSKASATASYSSSLSMKISSGSTLGSDSSSL